MSFSILYQDAHFLAINKPPDILVHKTKIANQYNTSVVDMLKTQLPKRAYPIHRLDRRTSGVLLFAFNTKEIPLVQKQFQDNSIEKKYVAILRGYAAEEGFVDYAIKTELDPVLRPAQTSFRRLATTELPIPVSRYSTARYSLVELTPHTGRTHQLRRHAEHLRHPILGDRKYGDRHHNRMLNNHLNIYTMMLTAYRLVFTHPFTQERIALHAPLHPDFLTLVTKWGWKPIVDSLMPPLSDSPPNG